MRNGGKDISALNRLFDDDYVFTGSRGETWGKEKALEDFRRPDFSLEYLRTSELEVIVRQGVSIVTGISHVGGKEGDKAITGEYRFTRIWCMIDSDWRIVATHTSRIDAH